MLEQGKRGAMYLTKDYIGASTKKTKGVIGDLVEILEKGYPMWLVQNPKTGEKFFVWPEHLTESI